MANLAQEGSQSSEVQCGPAKRVIWDRGVFETFEEMGLQDELLKEIKEYGYEKPTAVQQGIIVSFDARTDVLAEVAECEPGKTSAICLGILQKLECDLKECQAIVFTVNATRSQEIGKDLRKLGASLDLKVHVLGEDEPSGSSGIHVFVGHLTPALYWLETNGGISWTNHIKVVVLDKADWLCSRPGLPYIFGHLLPSRDKYQICVFSETLSPKVYAFAEDWMHIENPVEICLPSTLKLDEGNVTHLVIDVMDEDMRPYWLLMLYNQIKTTSVVLVNDPKMIEYLVKTMKEQKWENPKWEVLSTHDHMNQKDRNQLKQSLHAQGGPKVLLTTEEWANGVDLTQVELVVNYDMPRVKPDDYLNRMRRFGGRADAINLVTRHEWHMLFDIQEHFGNTVAFEGTPIQPSQVGPAGFSDPLQPSQVGPAGFSESPKILKNNMLPGPSEDIQHLLYHVEGEELKTDLILRNLSKVMVKTKSVIFAKIDLIEKLRGIDFIVFTMEDLEGFCKCQEERCALLITTDVDTPKHAHHTKVPLVINCDLPSTAKLYDHRIAWCQRNGVAIHFVSDYDWFKVFRFQSPPQSFVGWAPADDELSEIIAKANSVESQDAESVHLAKRLKLMEYQELNPNRHMHFLDEPQLLVSELYVPPEPTEAWDAKMMNKICKLHLGPEYANLFFD